MKNILIPTDFSKNSYKSINYITELFKNETCAFYFLNVYSYEVGGLDAIEMLKADDAWFEKPGKDSLKKLGDLLEEFEVKNNNIKHEYHIISESLSLVDAIEKQIDARGIDLIALDGNAMINKNIINEIRRCPIFVVPAVTSNHKIENLTIASSFLETVKTLEIDVFLEALKNTNFEINILVLGKKENLTHISNKNIELLRSHLENYSDEIVKLKFLENLKDLDVYAVLYPNSILCLVDKKPDLLRKLGLYKSEIISTIEKLDRNPVLTIHQ